MSQKIARTIFYLTVFLIPLFTLPFTANVLDFSKQLLFLLMILLALFFWVLSMVVNKNIVVKYNKTFVFVFAFLAIVLVSGVLSQYAYGSFWGLPLSVADSFVTLLGFSLMYLLAVNLFEKSQIKNLIFVVAVSGALAALYALLQSFGLYLAPLGYAKSASFNTVGTTGGLAFMLVILFSAVLPLLFSCKGWKKWILVACLAFYGLDLVLFNVTLAWTALVVGLLASFLFAMSSDEFAKRYRNARAVTFAFLAVAIVFASIDFFASDVFSGAYAAIYKQIGFAGQTYEVYLSQSATARLAVDTAKQSAKTFILGSGPGTFIYDFEKFKPLAIAQNDIFWNVEFTTGASQVLDTFITLGLLGLLGLLVLLAYTTFNGFRMLTEDNADSDLFLAIFAGWLASVAMIFLFPFIFTSMFVFWFFLAVLGIAGPSKTRSFEVGTIKVAYFVSLAMIVLLVCEVGFIVWISKRYYAEVKYKEALLQNDVDKAINDMALASMAVQDMQDNYLTGLSQLYLAKANQLLSQANQQNQKDAGSAVADNFANAYKLAQLATDKVNPSNPDNWAVKGYVLSQFAAVGAAGDPAGLAKTSFQRALALEPSNASLWLQMGQVMLINKDLNGAKTDFGNAIDLNPKYSDARYYLGLVLDQQGDKQAAIDQFNIISQLNPDNQTITQILQNLQAGKPALGQQAQQVQQASQTQTGLSTAPSSLQEQQSLPGALPVPSNLDNGNASPAPQGVNSDSVPSAQGNQPQPDETAPAPASVNK